MVRPALNLNLNSLDEVHIILDIGLSHAKVGFAKDPVPKHIIPTPLSMVDELRDSLGNLNMNSFTKLFENRAKLLREVEEFLVTIFYHLLQTNPKQKAVVIVESFLGLRPLIEAIGHSCFK